ncbi:DUF2785 domain-containing protein [Weissella tructae]
MATDYSELRQEVSRLRQRVLTGELYNSLGDVLGRWLDEIDHTIDRTQTSRIVGMRPDDEHELTELMIALRTEEKKDVTDDELELLVKGLHAKDFVIRDAGALTLLTELIQGGVLGWDQVKRVAFLISRDDYLFAHIDEAPNDAVFTRAAAVNLLAVIFFWGPRQYQKHLPVLLQTQIIERFALYMALERDNRGMIADKGLAQTYLQVGQFLDATALNEQVQRADKIFLLTLMVEALKRQPYAMVTGEDWRLVTYWINLLNLDQIYVDYALNLLKQWRKSLVLQRAAQDEVSWTRLSNQKHFLQGLLVREKLPEEIREYLNQAKNILA